MMKITILQGSPRKDGNTAMLAEAFANGARQKHEVRSLDIASLTIHPCKACNACFTNNKCIQKDDIEQIYNLLLDTDMLVIASPIYFYGISAQLKAAIDRLHNPIKETFHISKAALLLVGGSSKPWIFDAAQLQYEICLKYFSIQDMGQITQGSVREKGDISATDALDRAYKLGAQL